MQGTSKPSSSNPYTYNGWYLAKYMGNAPISSAKGNFTRAEFKVDLSNSPRNETILMKKKMLLILELAQ